MKKPIVAIDARMVTEIPHGISRYVSSIAKGLQIRAEALPYQPLFLVHSGFSQGTFYSFPIQKMQTSFLDFKELFEIPKVLKALNAALYHSPSFSSLWSSPCASVITIHDLNHLTYGNGAQKIYYRVLLKRFAKQAQAVLTVSDFSKSEIATWLNIDVEKVRTIYNTIEAAPSASENEDLRILESLGLKAKKYFLCLGNPKPHKNVGFLVKAYQLFKTRFPEESWPLVLSLNLPSPPSPGVLALGHVPDSTTQVLLRQAGALFSPSLYEGFGLPPVEAAALGVPVVLSSIPAHQEGLSDLRSTEALWVSPTDLEGWAKAFEKVQRNLLDAPSPSSQEKILNHYSVQRMGRDIDQIYKTLLKGMK